MKAAKYTAVIVKRVPAYVSNETGNLVSISSNEALLDGFNGEDKKYTWIELFTKLGTITANTLRALNDNAWTYAENNQLGFDFELHIIKK